MKPRRKTSAVPVGELLAPALRELGMPSARLTRRVEAAWTQAADPGWRGQARPRDLVGGVLTVDVRSASLREELAQFHNERLLKVLQAALPDLVLVGIRFSLRAEAPRDVDERQAGGI